MNNFVPLSFMDSFENFVLKKIETKGNITGVFVSLGTGNLRMAGGAIQVISGLAALIFYSLGEALAANQQEKWAWNDGVRRSISHIKHGMGNVVRGRLESEPFGGVLCVFICRFKGRMKYIGEQKVLHNKRLPPPPYQPYPDMNPIP